MQEKKEKKEKSDLVLDQHVGVVRARGRPTELDKRELKRLIPLMTNDEAKKLVEYFNSALRKT
jgi:hypothetical protein